MHKKILAGLAVLSCLLCPQSRANDIEPTKEFYTAIHRGAAPVVIDGNMTEWTGVPVLSDPKFSIPKGSGPGGAIGSTCAQCTDDQASPNYVLWESLGGTWSGPDDQTSAVEVVWDADNVYLGFIVTDDYHENAVNSAWNGDSVQLMITKADRAGAAGTGYFLYNFALGGTEDALNDPLTQTIAELETRAPGVDETDVSAVVRRDTATKKTYYEIRLSARALGLTAPITAGTKFGLGMAINDGDQAEPGQKGWGGLGAHSIVYQKTPSETALVTLSDQTPGADLVFFSAVNPQITSFSFRANDKGTSISDPATAKLTINGSPVTLVPGTKTGGAVDFTYTPASPFAPGSVNTYSIEIKDTNGTTASESGSFTTPQYAVLVAGDKVTADTTKRGFIWNIHQSGPLVENSYVRAISQLEGRYGPNRADPAAQGNAIAAGTPSTDPNKPVKFEIETVINENIDLTTGLGSFPNDEAQMPGTPGIDPTPMAIGAGLNDGIAVDLVTYVELTQGLHTLIVNSDDGFKTFVGQINDVFKRKLAGSFDQIGGRGAADSPFVVFVPENGVYAVRTIFHQGGGGGNIELIEQLANGTKVLLNDDANGGPKTYRVATGNDVAGLTAVTSVSPGIDDTRADGNGPVTVTIAEGSDTVDLSSVVLKIDGVTIATTPAKSGNIITVSGKPAEPLSPRALHNASITFKAGAAAARTETWSFRTVRFGSGTLFIEAEDFNFGHGQYDTANPIGMTGYYSGGTYLDKGDGNATPPCTGSDSGIDYLDNDTLDATDASPYRSTTNVEAAKRNGPAGRDRDLFFVDVDHTVGWTGGAEWMNYTRDFPTTGTTTYKVYARMAHGDGGAGILRGGILMRVTSDPTVCDQTTTELGRFSGPWTGGWDTWPDAGTPQDALLPMVDNAGSPVIVRISGKQTLRWQFANNAGDLDYIAFVPFATTGLPAKVTSVSPTEGATGWGATQPFNATIVNPEFGKIASAKLELDGVVVPATVTLTPTGATVSYTPSPLSSGTHTYKLSYTDDATPPVTQSSTINFGVTFTPFNQGTLFIEAEDFNFGRGQYDTANPIGMTGAYPGGTYQDKGDGNGAVACDDTAPTDLGIDYMDDGLAATDAAPYRPNTGVEAAKRNGSAGLSRQLFSVNVNHVIGWTGGSEWLNYTRDFPATATAYRVFARMAHGDANNGTRGGILFKVSGDTTKCADPNQTTEELGTFTAPWTGGWDTWPDAGTAQDALIPLKDANGNVAKVTLGGKTTLRFQYANNAGDFDYLAFVPVGNTPPKFLSFSPPSTGRVQGNFFSELQDQDLTVTGASLKLDGTAVNATVTKAGDVTTIKYPTPTGLTPGSAHTYTLTYTDSGGATWTRNANFTLSFTSLPEGTLFIEGEDFNFGHGQYVTDQAIGVTGPYVGGSYLDKGDGNGGAPCDGSDYGIDYNDDALAATDAAPYRSNTGVEAAKRNGPAGLYRGLFNVEVNHAVGWTSGAEWMNYTRDFPTPAQKYKVFARMAHGDGAAQRGGILFTVQGDPTLCAADSQTTTELGRFAAPWTGGWDTWPDAGTTQDALIPMKDSTGAIAEVNLGGKTTIRWQFDLGAGDLDYIAFVPTGGIVEPPKPTFTKFQINANGSITIEWTGAGTLETSTALAPNGTWTPVTGATSPFTFTPQAGVPMLFGRIKQ